MTSTFPSTSNTSTSSRLRIHLATWALLTGAGIVGTAFDMSRPLVVTFFLGAIVPQVLVLRTLMSPTLHRDGPLPRSIWLAAIAIRLLALGVADPVWFSTDIHRYVFEGHAVRHGQNPYRVPPDSPRWDAFTDEHHLHDLRAGINQPTIATIYPPLAEALFAIGTYLHPGLLGWRLLVVMIDLVGAWCLMRLLRAEKKPVALTVIYLLHPLVVIEGAISGHVDIPAVVALVAAMLAWHMKTARWAVAFVFVSALVKALGLLAAPLFLRRHLIPTFGLASVAAVLLWLPAWRPDDETTPATVDASSVRADERPLRRDWDGLIGRYLFAAPEVPWLHDARLDFDATGRYHGDREGLYWQDADGAFAVQSPDDDETIRVFVTRRRLRLVPGDPTSPAYAIKIVDDWRMGATQYSLRWSGNGPMFRGFLALAEHLGFAPRIARPWIQRLVAVFVLGLAFLFAWRRLDPTTSIRCLFAIVLVTSPVIHPWYLLWVVPFLRRDALSIGLATWTGTVLLTYLVEGGKPPAGELEAIEYGLAVLASLLWWIRDRAAAKTS